MTVSADALLGDEVRLLGFSLLGSEQQELHFALNTHKVREVIDGDGLSPLPEGFGAFVGIYDLRGVPVPVLDLGQRLMNRPSQQIDRSRPRIIIAEVMERLIGLLVPKTNQITTHTNEEILPPPPDLVGLPQNYINGLINSGHGKFLYLIDIEGLLAEGRESDRFDRKTPKDSYRNQRVLIVEDSPLFLKRAQHYFSEMGFTVEAATNGKTGLALLKKDPGRYRLVFADIEMPIMNGLEMVREMKADPALAGVPVIFNTSISNPTVIDEVRQLGLGEYVVKFDPALIAQAVEKVLGS